MGQEKKLPAGSRKINKPSNKFLLRFVTKKRDSEKIGSSVLFVWVDKSVFQILERVVYLANIHNGACFAADAR